MRMFLNAHAWVNAHPLSVDLFKLIAQGVCANGFGIFIKFIFVQHEKHQKNALAPLLGELLI